MENVETTEKPADKIVRVAMQLGVTMIADFVPFSQSRSAKEKSPSLNWRVTIGRNGRDILTTDYSAGAGHCPSYRQNDRTVYAAELLKWECENGYKGLRLGGGFDRISKTGKQLKPKIEDVLYSLAVDSDVMDYGTFEEWATNFGYDADSRKAQTIYRQCLEIALKLRNGLGEEGLQQIREARQNY